MAMHESTWQTASQAIGIHNHEPKRREIAKATPIAGLTTHDAAYASAANDFPRFERQMIRTIFDKDVISGKKQPHPELLRRYPNREIPDQNDRTWRPPTGQSMASGRSRRSDVSGRSDRSYGSHRSAISLGGSSIASSKLSAPPSGYYRQVPTPNLMYNTSSSLIGGGGYIPKEPQPGREVWMVGRGGGQQSSFDNCLVRKGNSVPFAES
eukprot:TRINITY_DN2113_c1_g5_i1.p1 TRINITY_DN2113_c1_g5~~TRINITY_DN2113_c1_g5_i1.p1  ORF type:complete len:210 (+),score=32.79 TRINITY_DN2113_c1_g5_i1:106-735(+)